MLRLAPLREQLSGPMIVAIHSHQERSSLVLAPPPANQQQNQGLLVWLRHDRPDVQFGPVQCRYRIGCPGLGCQGQIIQAARLYKPGSPGH